VLFLRMTAQIVEQENTRMSRESSLRASILDGIFASIMMGFTVNYTTPFAVLIGANNFFIGLLNSIPQLFGSFVQLKSADIVKKIKSRVKSISWSVFLQASTYLVISLFFLISKKSQVEIFILLITINTVFGCVATPAWASLMSDTVEKNKYGEYFSWRGKVLGFVSLASSFVAGFFLFVFPNKFLGFIILFFLAGICRFISGIYLSKMDDIPVETLPNRDFSYFQFIRRFSESNFVKFTLFVSLMNFATFLAAPFFAVYMLDTLKFKYSTYTIITSAGAIAGLISLPFWGKFADRYGNVKIIKASAKLIPLMPIFWLFTKNPFILTVVNAFAGYIWTGFNLCIVNFIFDATSSDVRTRCVGYFNFTNGFFIFLGSLIGGWLAMHLPEFIFNSSLLTLFLVSGLARVLVNIFLLNSFNEVREAEKIEDRELLYIITGLIPVLSLGEEVFYRKKGQFDIL